MFESKEKDIEEFAQTLTRVIIEAIEPVIKMRCIQITETIKEQVVRSSNT